MSAVSGLFVFFLSPATLANCLTQVLLYNLGITTATTEMKNISMIGTRRAATLIAGSPGKHGIILLSVSIASMVGTVLENINMKKIRDPLSLWFLFGIAVAVTDTKIFQQYMLLMKKGINRMLWRFSGLKKPPSVIFPW